MRAPLALMLVSLLAGCPDRTIAGVPVVQGTVEVKDIPAVPRKDVDILFLIDDSLSMVEEQESLKNNFSRFIGVLESIQGGMPNVHIGVVTPNLGTSAIDGTKASPVGTCVNNGENGKLRRTAGNMAFLSDIDNGVGGRTRNYTGTLADAFKQLATVGANGCGIEQHLEAVKRALDNNPENAGFLRPNALLAIVIVADEDDCSLAKSTLFDGNTGDPTYGDRVNFKCTREGVACDNPSNDLETVGGRTECHPKYDSTLITQTDRYVDFLKGLKADPTDVIVAGILGDTGPFEVVKKNGVSVLKQSCQYNGTTGTQYAYPAIRTRDFLDQFAFTANATICTDDLSGAVTEVALLLKRKVGEPCFVDKLPMDMDPDAEGPQYDCSVVDQRLVPNQPPEDLAVIPQCDATKSRNPCWHIDVDDEHCGFTQVTPHLKLFIERGGVVPGPEINVKASCVTEPGGNGPVQ